MAKFRLTKNIAREIGWNDGYSGSKKDIKHLHLNRNNIPDYLKQTYIDEYNLGYETGRIMSNDFNKINLVNNELIHYGHNLDEGSKIKRYTK